MLNLANNDIGDEGAQHLGNALESNTVSLTVLSSMKYINLLYHLVTQDAESCLQ